MRRNHARLPTAVAALVFAACAEPSNSPYAPQNHRRSLSTDWPNEPASLTTVSDYGFDDALPSGNGQPLSGGWQINNPNGLATQLTNDAEAQLSPPDVGQWSFPVGFQGGSAPALMYLIPPAFSKEVYVGVWFKASDPWQDNGSGANELFNIATASPNSGVVLDMHGVDSNTYNVVVTPEFAGMTPVVLSPNVTATAVTLGQWHRVEWYMKYSTTATSGDGIITWWLDGVQQGFYENQNMPADSGFGELHLRPAWDGSETKTEQDYMWFDHVHISENTGAASSPWPNEPAGYTLVSDQRWDSLTSDGWQTFYNEVGNVTIAQDGGAPLSPPSIVQYRYPIGFFAGSGPGEEVHGLTATQRVYAGLWWKPSNPWQGDVSNVNKIEYIQSLDSGSITLVMYGTPGGPYELRVYPQFTNSQDRWLTPNVNDDSVALGVWHRVEWLVDYSGTSGHIQWWLDGRLQGDWGDDSIPRAPLVEYQLNPVWGGVDTIPKREADYYWFDHTHVSIK